MFFRELTRETNHAAWRQVGLHREAAAAGGAHRGELRESWRAQGRSRAPGLGDGEQDVGWRPEERLGAGEEDESRSGAEGRPCRWPRVGVASQVGALGVRAESRGYAQAERGRFVGTEAGVGYGGQKAGVRRHRAEALVELGAEACLEGHRAEERFTHQGVQESGSEAHRQPCTHEQGVQVPEAERRAEPQPVAASSSTLRRRPFPPPPRALREASKASRRARSDGDKSIQPEDLPTAR
jgi:hypothetical protein